MAFTKEQEPWNKGKKGVQVAWNKGKPKRWITGGEFKKGHKINVGRHWSISESAKIKKSEHMKKLYSEGKLKTTFKKGCNTWFKKERYTPEKHPAYKGFDCTSWCSIKKAILYEQKSCELCGIDNIIVLNVHHKDKNHNNNKRENLQVLCANCHYIIHNKKFRGD